MAVRPFRQFKVPQIVETQFFEPRIRQNEEFMKRDLARSGLAPEDLQAYAHPQLRLPNDASAGYVIPYFGLDGQPLTDANQNLIMFRTRLDVPEFSKLPRYLQPSTEQLAKYGLPPNVPYIHPESLELEGDTIVCAEGEKKAVSIFKFLRLPVFGIGGCNNWRNPNGDGSLHPWIRELLVKYRRTSITIVPDGDVFRYDICNAYGNFARACEAEGFNVQILSPEEKIDDLLVRWGPEALPNWNSLNSIKIDDLVQSPSALAKKYSLAFKTDAKGKVIVYQHTANIVRLLEEHPAFPKIWRNQDTNRVMVGEDPAQPDLTEMQIANYFQYNLGMDKVTHRTMYSCIQSQAKKNARSPMLEWIQSQIWDGESRLDTWIEKFWGAEDSAYTREVAAKWLISACARMHKPGTKIDWMLIVVGPQGTGKTSMPNIVFRGHALTLYGEHSDKDLHMLLHSSLCVGFDELDSFSKREASNLKAMITRNDDAFRPPYGASVEVFPRRFTLYGCGNRYEFLQHDPSGYRRYAIIEVKRLLDFAGLESNLPQLWAEAWHRYSTGSESYWEIGGASDFAEKYVIPNPLEDSIISVIDSWKTNKNNAHFKDGFVYFTMTQILSNIGSERDSRNTHHTREVAAILRKMGAEQKMGSAPTGTIRGRYYCIRA